MEYKDFQNNNKQLFIQNLITTKADSKPEVLKEIQKVLKRNFQIMPINLDVAPKKPRAANIFYKIDARPEIVAENPGNTLFCSLNPTTNSRITNPNFSTT